MKKLKKLTSVFLAVIMALGVLTVAPFTASAASIGTVSEKSSSSLIKAWPEKEVFVYGFGNYEGIAESEAVTTFSESVSNNSTIEVTGIEITKEPYSPSSIDYYDYVYSNTAISVRGTEILIHTADGINLGYILGVPDYTASDENTWTAYYSGFDSDMLVVTYYKSTNEAQIEFKGFTAAIDPVILKFEPIISKISKIEITKLPDKKEYVKNVDTHNIDLSGLELLISYTDGTSKTYKEDEYFLYDEDDLVWVETDTDELVVGQNEITISYHGLTTSFNINVIEDPHIKNPVTKIEVTKLPNKTFTKSVNPSWINSYGDIDTDSLGFDYIEFCHDYLVNKNMQGAELTVHYKNGERKIYSFKYNCTLQGYASIGWYFWEEEYDKCILVKDLGNYRAEINFEGIKTTFTAKNSGNTIQPTSIKLNQTSLTLGAGESYTLTKSVSPSNASTSYTWSSSNTSVATVSNGKVTAKKSGTANITVKTSNGKTATCKVTVKPAPTSVKTNPTSLTLGKGETYTISESTNIGSYANAANLKWSTSNSSVATVTKSSGNKATITAKGVGTAYIKITLYNGKTAQCKVTVKPAPTSVKTNPTSLTLGKGETYTISESTNSGSYANAANLKWSTSNSSVATVTKGSGNKATITAKGVGTAYIKITLYNGKTAQCKVTVKPAPTSVKTSPTSVTLGKGETYTISESTNSGSYANAANLKWSTSNSSVATVTKGSGNKATITAKGVGTAYIKITLYNGKTAQCKVTVKNAPSSVSLSKTSLTLSKGATYTISEMTNSGSYSNAANLKWTSTNSSVATVTKGSGNKAVISAKAKGTAYIKITLYNGKTAQCKVTVK